MLRQHISTRITIVWDEGLIASIYVWGRVSVTYELDGALEGTNVVSVGVYVRRGLQGVFKEHMLKEFEHCKNGPNSLLIIGIQLQNRF